MHVGSQRKDEVTPQIPRLNHGTDHRQAESREIAKYSAADERNQHDGPVWEGLMNEMVKDDLCCQSAKDKGHRQAEEDESIVAEEAGVGREEPGADRQAIDKHR